MLMAEIVPDVACAFCFAATWGVCPFVFPEHSIAARNFSYQILLHVVQESWGRLSLEQITVCACDVCVCLSCDVCVCVVVYL